MVVKTSKDARCDKGLRDAGMRICLSPLALLGSWGYWALPGETEVIG